MRLTMAELGALNLGLAILEGERPPDEQETIRYSAKIAAWIAEREGVEPGPDGSVTVEYTLGDREWAVRHVLQYGPEAEVVGPMEVREMVVERLEGMMAV